MIVGPEKQWPIARWVPGMDEACIISTRFGVKGKKRFEEAEAGNDHGDAKRRQDEDL